MASPVLGHDWVGPHDPFDPPPPPAARTATGGDARTLAAWLTRILGPQLTAYLAGVDDADTVERWATGAAQPDPRALGRMRHAYHAAGPIEAATGPVSARSWLFGINPVLDGEAPASRLRRGETPDDWRPVHDAARNHVTGSH